LRSWGALSGLLFVVLFVIGTALMFSGNVSGDDPPAKFQAYYGDSGHRDRINMGWIIAGLSLFFFLWFVASLRETVRDVALREVQADDFLSTVVTIGGTAYAAVTMAAFGLSVGVRTMSDDTFQHQVYPGIIHAADDGTYLMHATGTAAVAAMILAFSLWCLRSRMLPRWLGWLGLLAAVCALASILFVTTLVWLLWIAIVSVLLFLRLRGETTTQTSRPTTT
jgi:hypothetical protein